MKVKIKKKNIKKIMLRLFILCTILFICYQFIYTIYTILNPDIPCQILGLNIYVIKYDTMEPKIKKGDLVITSKPKEEKLQKGTIISFKKGNEFIVHRIEDIEYKKNGKFYRTKGDNNIYVDNELLTIEDIQGKYLFKIRNIIPIN